MRVPLLDIAPDVVKVEAVQHITLCGGRIPFDFSSRDDSRPTSVGVGCVCRRYL